MEGPPRSRDRRESDAEFVEEVPEEWYCPICQNVLLDPQLLGCCGHHLCQACVSRLLGDRRPCPLCNQPEYTVLLNKGLQRIVLEAQVHCPNRSKGCEWTGTMRLVTPHLSSTGDPPGRAPLCQYETVPCTNEGCRQLVLRINLQQHVSSECEHRRHTCQYCGAYEGTRREVVEHHWPECPSYPTSCPNRCGVADMPRSSVAEHVDRDCPAQVVPCVYWDIGCRIRRPRRDLEAHMNVSDIHHGQLLVRKTLELQRKVEERDTTIQNLTDQLGKQATDFEAKLQQKDALLATLTSDLGSLQGEVSTLTSRTANVKTELGQKAEQDEVAQVVTVTAVLQSSLEAKEKRLEKVEQENRSLREALSQLKKELEEQVNSGIAAAKEEIGDGLRERVEHLEGVVVEKKVLLEEAGEDMEKRVADLKSDLLSEVKGVKDVREEMELEYNKHVSEVKDDVSKQSKKQEELEKDFAVAVETRKEEMGRLEERVAAAEAELKEQAVAQAVGRMEEVEKEIREKIEKLRDDICYVERTITPTPPFSFTVSRFSRRKEKKESFVSTPFYTNPRGYKMVVRVDAGSTDSHVSVWCCITRGEHDEHLEWPLRANITIRLVNQKDKKKHYEKVISYDNQAHDKHAGRVVSGDKNYLWGLREFITYREVNNSSYLVGDALDFVVMSVELQPRH